MKKSYFYDLFYCKSNNYYFRRTKLVKYNDLGVSASIVQFENVKNIFIKLSNYVKKYRTCLGSFFTVDKLLKMV